MGADALTIVCPFGIGRSGMTRLDAPAGAEDAEGATDAVADAEDGVAVPVSFLSSHATHARSIMDRSTVRMSVRLARSAFISAILLAPAPASAEEQPAVRATMQCERALEPGRVRCSVEAHVVEGRSLAWADVVIVSLPELAAALKGRIAREDAVAREASSAKWAFGLVAKRAGQGEVRARVRAVTCEGFTGQRCVPTVVDVHTIISVGG
jgi:hypothetical protein